MAPDLIEKGLKLKSKVYLILNKHQAIFSSKIERTTVKSANCVSVSRFEPQVHSQFKSPFFIHFWNFDLSNFQCFLKCCCVIKAIHFEKFTQVLVMSVKYYFLKKTPLILLHNDVEYSLFKHLWVYTLCELIFSNWFQCKKSEPHNISL